MIIIELLFIMIIFYYISINFLFFKWINDKFQKCLKNDWIVSVFRFYKTSCAALIGYATLFFWINRNFNLKLENTSSIEFQKVEYAGQ